MCCGHWTMELSHDFEVDLVIPLSIDKAIYTQSNTNKRAKSTVLRRLQSEKSTTCF